MAVATQSAPDPLAKQRPGRVTRYSLPWLLLVPLVGYEVWAILRDVDGGPLSHVVWWAYGDRWSLRWWLISGVVNGLMLWAIAHFMFVWPGLRELALLTAVLVAVGLACWLAGVIA
jgi:hypothetical protein